MALITLFASPITLLQAKTSVVRPAGGGADSDQLAAAAEHLRNTLYDLNNTRDWKWLQNSVAASVTTDGIFTINAPTVAFKKVYALTDGTHTLTYINERDWLRQNPDGTALGGTFVYMYYDVAGTKQIIIKDAPATATTFTLFYLARLQLPSADGSTFDIPETAMSHVLAEATARYLIEKGAPDDQIERYNRQSAKALMLLIREDVKQPDSDPSFSPPQANQNVPRNFAPEWYQ